MFVMINLPLGSILSPQEQVKRWIENPISFWEECVSKYGETFTLDLGSLGTIVMFCDPKDIKEIFALNPHQFECHQYNKHYEYVMGSESLLLQDGFRHKRQKKLLLPPLQKEAVSKYLRIIDRHAKVIIADWDNMNNPIKVRPFMHKMALRIILEILFNSLDHPISKILEKFFTTQVFQDFGAWSPWAKFGKIQTKIRPLLSAEIRACRENSDRNPDSMFNLFVQAKDENGELLNDAEIQDDVFTLLIAGVDTVALALSWALYWIHNDPNIKDTLKQELATLDNIELREVLKLPYLNAVCQETLRMYPVVTTPIGRKLTEDLTIGDRLYPKGVTLLPCTYLVHHREDIYPNPSQFQPERFLNHKYANYEYFPFGGGNRLCLGTNLAPVEIKLILARILTQYEFKPVIEGEITPIRHATLLAPSDNLKFQITRIDFLQNKN
jgi:cytochrome P450